ncbi:MAG TPA: DUF2269 domain-containing protein [Actinomycetota bacterium]|nr:DUF2269 domain-containing protein [Actinomycetota bacterium]
MVLTAHLFFSVGWTGAVCAYLALGLSASRSAEAGTIRAAWIGMELVGWFVIVPLAVGSLITGILIALGTSWGLFRHYWVIFSLALTVFAVVILLLHMPTVSASASVARQADIDRLTQLGGDLFHPGLGLALLLVIQVLNVFKPRGMTRHGQRARAARGSTAVPGGLV